jgi:hypothetical protein
MIRKTILTPDSPECTGIADNRGKLAEPYSSRASGLFAEAGTVLKACTQMQERNHEFGGVLNELDTFQFKMFSGDQQEEQTINSLLGGSGHVSACEDNIERRAHSLPLQVLRYRRR